MNGCKNLAEYNIKIHRSKGIGKWRRLYKDFLDRVEFNSLAEIGAGPPMFLKEINCSKKLALDCGNRWKGEYKNLDIEFINVDLDRDYLPEIGKFDIVVCSDVFEHLIFPERTLKYIREIIGNDGILFSHVPNEFTLKQTFSIMMGNSESKYFHKFCEECNDPHLHRFTKIGFEKFLIKEFEYNIYIGDIKYGFFAKLLSKLNFTVPYSLEGGPTFISTCNENKFKLFNHIKKQLK